MNRLEQRLEDAFHALNEGTMPPDRYTALNNGLVAQKLEAVFVRQVVMKSGLYAGG